VIGQFLILTASSTTATAHCRWRFRLRSTWRYECFEAFNWL